ncbi:WD40/YVTN/BNR-like repeat-containing protein [Cesiribacter andamanensis]|uniref:Plant photosystem II stability/assembly factor-like protein n=1 Tax=Cesiribacter andamanensis AMV16 TaxID=1279009 RepID=M7NB23_9BACT|nr:plant photosystem II stability/assembly factor-like protein [Cesiribacter andamanensis]EMR04391.1 plant photosystem II stability/assembly factor-like protein [Cesiribacter andamanensis AMV16]
MKKSFLFLSLLLAGATALAQQPLQPSAPSSPQDIRASWQQKSALQQTSILRNYALRSIGPVVQGARITDLAVAANPKTFYVAYASGGVFKTENAGDTFVPIFDNQGALGIGDIALAPSDESILYVGTGEKNSSRSSYAGAGVYKSTDAGASWQHLGLEGTQHISRIVVHPQQPQTVWVAAMGALYTNNADRGVYKSTDGGKNWQKTLYINDSTGIIDLEIDPANPNVLYAAAWERTRLSWNFKGSGANSAMYKSTDGGTSWKKLEGGFPAGQGVGRIGLSVAPSQPNTLYALLDNLEETKEELKAEKGKLTAASFLSMSQEQLLALPNEQLQQFLKDNRFPEKYTPERVKQEVRDGKYEPRALAEYLGDANQALFNTKVSGAEVYRSNDAGASWQKQNSYPLEGVYFTYGYYFGEIRTAPTNPDKLYILGVPMLSSNDGGRSWYRVDSTGNVHVDHQALWINPQDPEHLMLGNDGGLYISYDGGAHWRHVNNMSTGQFYTVAVDMETPYNVYGGLQDNGVLKGSSQSIPNQTEDWEHLMGGDGMFVQVDPRNSNLVYTGYQFGNYFRLELDKKKQTYISPRADIGEASLRFNWRSPLVMSSHNADILYMGAQRVYRTLNGGESWEPISPDLTKNLPQGNVPFSTIVSISESPLRFGLLYVGTDDGNIQLSRNGGASWELIGAGLPQNLWISSLQASRHQEGRVYATLTGYRFDDFRAYLYRSDDFGKTWQSIKGNLPEEAVNIVLEDPVQPQLLYAGTDHGAYLSLEGGRIWQPINELPNVATYDLIVHPRENELVLATHGRSVYIMDVKPLQTLAAGPQDQLLLVGEPSLRYSERWGQKQYPYSPLSEPRTSLLYHLPQAGTAQLEVLSKEGGLLYTTTLSGDKGFGQWRWNLKQNRNGLPGRKNKAVDGGYLPKDAYTVRLSQGGKKAETTLTVK